MSLRTSILNFAKLSLLGLVFLCCFYSNVFAINADAQLDIHKVEYHEDFDLEKIKEALRGLMNEYTKSTNKQHQKQIVLSLESKLKSQINEFPKHEKEILQAARTMIKESSYNWIILRNEKQLKINVRQTAQSKG